MIQYTAFRFDGQRKLTGETTIDGNGIVHRFARLSYQNGLIYSREEYTQKFTYGKIRVVEACTVRT